MRMGIQMNGGTDGEKRLGLIPHSSVFIQHFHYIFDRFVWLIFVFPLPALGATIFARTYDSRLLDWRTNWNQWRYTVRPLFIGEIPFRAMWLQNCRLCYEAGPSEQMGAELHPIVARRMHQAESHAPTPLPISGFQGHWLDWMWAIAHPTLFYFDGHV